MMNYIFLPDEIIYGETEERNLKVYTDRGAVVTLLILQKFQEIIGDDRFLALIGHFES